MRSFWSQGGVHLLPQDKAFAARRGQQRPSLYLPWSPLLVHFSRGLSVSLGSVLSTQEGRKEWAAEI